MATRPESGTTERDSAIQARSPKGNPDDRDRPAGASQGVPDQDRPEGSSPLGITEPSAATQPPGTTQPSAATKPSAAPQPSAATRPAGPTQRSGLGKLIKDHRRSVLVLLALCLGLIFVFAILPQLAGFGKTIHRIRYGNKVWLVAGVGLECISLFGYMALFRMMFSCEGVRITWRSSYNITLAGTVATKLLAAGGAGGIALTVWALRAAGLSARAVARRMTSFEMLLYGVFMGALVVFGGGIALGLMSGAARPALTALPAVFGAVVIILVLGLGFASDSAQRWLSELARRSRRGRNLLTKLATVPRTLHDGVRMTAHVLRHPRPGLLGAIIYWAFDIATLWAAFRAFGDSPPIAVLVLGYYIGQLANALPIPGGIGGVEGGMIGSFIAFGVSGSTAALAVLSYRLISFWLPILPGSIAYLRLRATVSHWNESQDSASGDAASEPANAPQPQGA
jgi:putative heme transporter